MNLGLKQGITKNIHQHPYKLARIRIFERITHLICLNEVNANSQTFRCNMSVLCRLLKKATITIPIT